MKSVFKCLLTELSPIYYLVFYFIKSFGNIYVFIVFSDDWLLSIKIDVA